MCLFGDRGNAGHRPQAEYLLTSLMAGSGGLSRRRKRANRRNIRGDFDSRKVGELSRRKKEGCRTVDIEDLGVVMPMVLLILGRRDLVSSHQSGGGVHLALRQQLTVCCES